jgi:transposase
VKAFLDQIPVSLRQTITNFTTDMWEGYLQAASDFTDEHDDVEAEIVVDRFHVAENYRDSFDTLRKRELKRLKRKLSEEQYEQICKKMLWVLRKNHANLDSAERLRLKRLFEQTPLLHQAYTFREELTAIFNRSYSREQAERAIQAWCHKVWISPVQCYDGFIKTLRRYWTYILNYFSQRISSGFVEGLNNKLKVIKRRCYGIKKVTTLFQRIWLDLEGRARFFVSTT